MRNRLFIIRYNLMHIDNNIEDTLNVIFVYVDKDVDDDVKDICEIGFNNKVCFVNNIKDV